MEMQLKFEDSEEFEDFKQSFIDQGTSRVLDILERIIRNATYNPITAEECDLLLDELGGDLYDRLMAAFDPDYFEAVHGYRNDTGITCKDKENEHERTSDRVCED